MEKISIISKNLYENFWNPKPFYKKVLVGYGAKPCNKWVRGKAL